MVLSGSAIVIVMTSRQRLERRFAVLCPTLTLLGIAVFLLVPVNSRICSGLASCNGGTGFLPVLTVLSWPAVAALALDFLVSLAVAWAGMRHAAAEVRRSRETLVIGTAVLAIIVGLGITTVGAFLAPAALSAVAATALGLRRQ